MAVGDSAPRSRSPALVGSNPTEGGEFFRRKEPPPGHGSGKVPRSPAAPHKKKREKQADRKRYLIGQVVKGERVLKKKQEDVLKTQ
jgi:hypothetical protein